MRLPREGLHHRLLDGVFAWSEPDPARGAGTYDSRQLRHGVVEEDLRRHVVSCLSVALAEGRECQGPVIAENVGIGHSPLNVATQP